MSSPFRAVACSAIAFACLGARIAAHADDSNFRPYLVGARAAGMGGAFTALADDGSGSYYNPGGLAFVRKSQLSLSGSAYGLVGGSLRDALGNGHDFNFQDFNTFPVSASAVVKFKGDTEDSGQTLSISVFIPDAVKVDDRDSLGSTQNAFSLIGETQTVWAGATYARRFGRWGVGVSAFFLLGTNTTQLDITAVAPGSSTQFATISSRTSESIFGGVGSAGVRWDVTDDFHLGLSVFSPEIGGGSRRVFVRSTSGDFPGQPAQIVVVNVENLSASPTLPLRAQLGGAWSIGKLTLSADAIFLAPREVQDDQNRTGEGLNRRVTRKAVLNGAVGMEYIVGDSVPLRFGLFTDFAASPSPVASPPGIRNPGPDNTSHVNRYGGSFSIGYQSEHTETDIGANLSFGSGEDLIPNNLNFADLKVTSSTTRNLYLFLASAYHF